jgi:hypothetical protein
VILSRVLSPSCLERGLTPVLHWGFFCVSVHPVTVERNEEDLLMHRTPTGCSTRCSSKSFFFARTPRVSSGPRWAAGKRTSARVCHPLRAAQRSRATAQAPILPGGLGTGVE